VKKRAMISYAKSPKNDEVYTPAEAVRPLLPFLPRGVTVWEPTDPGGSKIAEVLRAHGWNVVSTHKESGLDFLTDDPPKGVDLIVTNPPYSLKTAFLKRAYELSLPFAMLLPIHTLEGVERGKLFRTYGVQVLVLDRRVRYYGKGAWFNSSWFCWKVLPKDLMFAELKSFAQIVHAKGSNDRNL